MLQMFVSHPKKNRGAIRRPRQSSSREHGDALVCRKAGFPTAPFCPCQGKRHTDKSHIRDAPRQILQCAGQQRLERQITFTGCNSVGSLPHGWAANPVANGCGLLVWHILEHSRSHLIAQPRRATTSRGLLHCICFNLHEARMHEAACVCGARHLPIHSLQHRHAPS